MKRALASWSLLPCCVPWALEFAERARVVAGRLLLARSFDVIFPGGHQLQGGALGDVGLSRSFHMHAFFFLQCAEGLGAATHQAQQRVHGFGLRHVVVLVLAERNGAAAKQLCGLGLGEV